MTELEALEIVRDRVRQRVIGADAELEEALSTLEEAIEPSAEAEAAAIASAPTSNDDTQLFEAIYEIADYIREQDVREELNTNGRADLAESASEEDLITAVTNSVTDLVLDMTVNRENLYWTVVELAAEKLIARVRRESKKE